MDTIIDDPAVADDRRTLLRNRMSWGAVIAGVVTALVVQILLNLLGIGFGASAVSATDTAHNPDAATLSMNAGIWWVASGVAASFIGGIAAGRLCGAGSRGTASWHGFIAWATSTLIVIVLLTSALSGLVGGAANVFGSVISGAGHAAAQVAGNVAPTNGDALQAQVKQLVSPNDAQTAQDDVISYIRASVDGDQNAANAARDRAVNSLAKAANISPDEARNRLSQAENHYKQTLEQAKQQATQAAEAARKGLASASIYGAAALALGLIASFLGGAAGAPRRVTGPVVARR